MDKVFQSPLHYVGGKRWIIDPILPYLPNELTEMVSPFFGGGALELNLANYKKTRVHAYDICPYLVNFWQRFLDDPSDFIADSAEILKKNTHTDLSEIKKRYNDSRSIEGAHLYYAFNRLSMQGMTLSHEFVNQYWFENDIAWKPKGKSGRRERVFSNYIGGQIRSQARFVMPIASIKKMEISVNQATFEEPLTTHADIFAYCDPPYMDTEDLYHNNGFDHLLLSDILKNRDNWILSYKDQIEIRELYQGYHIVELEKSGGYGGWQTKKGHKGQKELLILSHDIAAQTQSRYKQLYLF